MAHKVLNYNNVIASVKPEKATTDRILCKANNNCGVYGCGIGYGDKWYKLSIIADGDEGKEKPVGVAVELVFEGSKDDAKKREDYKELRKAQSEKTQQKRISFNDLDAVFNVAPTAILNLEKVEEDDGVWYKVVDLAKHQQEHIKQQNQVISKSEA